MDRYSKTVFTVIALALAVIAVEGGIGRAEAQQGKEPMKVQICNDDGFCANVNASHQLEIHYY